MRVVISAPSKYHFFDLGRQLHNRGLLTALMTGYPKSKLRDEADLLDHIQSFSYFHLIYRAISSVTSWDLEYRDRKVFDWFVSRNLPPCDIFMGIAASCLETSKVARSRGAAIVIDRPCSHIVVQARLIADEARKEGIDLPGIDKRVIDLELQEYALADLITVPSNFAHKSFLEQGFPESKLRVIPYGVDLQRFQKVGSPTDDEFNVLYVGLSSVRKGTPHLLRSFEMLKHPRKKLTIIGEVLGEVRGLIRENAAKQPIEMLGHLPQTVLKEHMSRCHVLVLPSIEDGFGLVMSQAMACGAPVVATRNTGADMLISEGVDGYIVPTGDDEALAAALQRLADDPDLRARMSVAAGEKAKSNGDWSRYGDGIVEMFKELRG